MAERGWRCECGAYNRPHDHECEACGNARVVTPGSTDPQVWHFDEDTGLAVPVVDPVTKQPVIHRCPDPSCAYYADPPARVDDLVTGRESIAEMRGIFRRFFGRIGGPVDTPVSLEESRRRLRDQAAALLRGEGEKGP